MSDKKNAPEMRRLNVCGEEIYIESPERFAWILKEKLGDDAAHYFNDLQTMGCKGECDYTYELQEHYERVIQGAVDELEAAKIHRTNYPWTSGKVSMTIFEHALKMLRNEL